MTVTPDDDFAAAEYALGTLDPGERAVMAARRLREVVPPQETVARWGGDEFLVIVDCSAEEVRDAIDAARNDNKNSVLMRVKSGGSSRFVAVPLAKG